MFIIAQIQEIRNNLGRLLGKVKVTDGENDMPAMDAESRAGYARVTDGERTAGVTGGDRALRCSRVPSRPTCDLPGGCLLIPLGEVEAGWTAAASDDFAPSPGFNLYITDIFLRVNGDATAEIAVQHIPAEAAIIDSTAEQTLAAVSFGIPNNTSAAFATPIRILDGRQFRVEVKLGGATDFDIDALLNGYEEIE
ncbi:MAG TPA: hypothetical protein PKH33_15820 [bacterium]|nr:hypothetical protein [bacterium]